MIAFSTRLAGAPRLGTASSSSGIPSQDLPHIFERFYRVDKARTDQSGHIGIGLSIAQAIARNHDAVIKVTSVPGQDSTFTVSLDA